MPARTSLPVCVCALSLPLAKQSRKERFLFSPVAGGATTSAANKQVEQEMASTCPTKWRKRRSYPNSDEEMCAKIAGYTAEHSFSVRLGKPLA